MAFSLRKMFSNISYFSKTGDDNPDVSPERYIIHDESSKSIEFDSTEPDSTSKQSSNSEKKSQSVQKFAVKKCSLSDTDLLNNDASKNRRMRKSLKLDIKKASQSMTDNLAHTGSTYIENTPKHILLDCRSADVFSEKFKRLNFNQSFDFDITSETSEDNVDIESLSEYSDTDISFKDDDKLEIKMCRKVESKCENELVPSVTPESFGDVEMDRNEEERLSLLLNYQIEFEKVESVLKKLLTEFQFHIEVSKIFTGKSIVPALPGTDVTNVPAMLGQVTYMDNIKRESPTDSWNIIIEKEDVATRFKFRKQLLSLKHYLDQFVTGYLQNTDMKVNKNQTLKRSITFDLHKGKRMHKNLKMSTKKRIKHFDFPDYRDALINLFNPDSDETDTLILQTEDSSIHKCSCMCHNNSLNQSDSGLTMKTDSFSNQSITSSIGNFSLDSTTLSAYSDSLDQVISYNSFQDTSLLNTLLQKPAIERITFYVQVHSIQLKCESADGFESKTVISFYCPACEVTENEEDGLLRHILSQRHCEKIHFLYKTAYIKKCMSSGKEIQPSTVLNPMKMYRDDNKVVCFGDAMYACSLCFENLISGESVLMSHCNDETHLERKQKLIEIFE